MVKLIHKQTQGAGMGWACIVRIERFAASLSRDMGVRSVLSPLPKPVGVVEN